MRPRVQTRICSRFLGAFILAMTVLAALGDNHPLRWRWSNPRPHGADVYSMAYQSGVTVQVGERGQIFTSDDLELWIPRTSNTTNALRGVTFLRDRIVVCGEKGTILWADSLEEFNLISLGTANWLESVAASSDRLLAVGDNGVAYTSPDGTNWTAENTGFTNWLRGVAHGGSSFVAVGESGLIAARANNGNWSIESSGTTENLNRVSFINNQFYAVGNNGIVLSANSSAKTWSPVGGLTSTNHFYSVAGTNNSLLVIGRNEVQLQLDGGAWTNQVGAVTQFPAPAWTYFSALWQGSLYFVAGRSGLMLEGFSTNSSPMLWISRTEPVRLWLWDLLRVSDFYVAVGDRALIMTSENGVRWQTELVPDSVTNTVFLGIGGDTNGLLAVGSQGTLLFSPNVVTNVIATNLLNGTNLITTNASSTLGISWFAGNRPITNDLIGAVRGNGLWVASGGGGSVLTSPDGTNWTQQSTPVTTFLSGAATGGGLFVVTGDAGVILTSADGTNWSSQISGTTNWIFRVDHFNGQFVAVGENGTVVTSLDGTNWTVRTSGTTEWLNSVTAASGVYYAVGTGGTMLLSTNLSNWESVPPPTRKSLYGIAATTNQLVVAGVEGALLRTPIQPLLDPVSFVQVSRTEGQNLMLVSGRTDQRFLLERSTNLVTWEDGVTFELLDESGTLLILESADTNSPPLEFVRGRVLP